MIGFADNPVLIRFARQQWKFRRIGVAILVQSVLLLVFSQLLLRAKLGRVPDLILISEILVILIVAPYLACSRLSRHAESPSTDDLLVLSRMSPLSIVGSVILSSQIYTACFVGVSMCVLTILIPTISEISRLQVVMLHVVFAINLLAGATVGGFWWRIFRHKLFATTSTYCTWGLLIGAVFLLSPLDRYLENLGPIIPPFLHLNPLVSACHLLEIDIFRTPYLYELTPITSYLFVYPSWYIVCGWQILIGVCCFILSWYGV